MARNDKEVVALERFRDVLAQGQVKIKVEGDLEDDDFLIRWLRARNLDIENAMSMLLKYLEWRTTSPELKMISMSTWKPSRFVTDRIKIKFTGYDYEERPIFWTDSGRWELGEILDAGLKDELFRFIYSTMDRYILPEISKQTKKNNNVSQMVFVMNTAGVTLRKALHMQSAQTRIRFVREFDAFYPEVLHSCYLLNAHWVITNLYAILRPFISTNTQAKINLFGTNRLEWERKLRITFPAESIPEDYGGTGPPFSALNNNDAQPLIME